MPIFFGGGGRGDLSSESIIREFKSVSVSLVSQAEERDRIRREQDRRVQLAASLQVVQQQIRAVEARLRNNYGGGQTSLRRPVLWWISLGLGLLWTCRWSSDRHNSCLYSSCRWDICCDFAAVHMILRVSIIISLFRIYVLKKHPLHNTWSQFIVSSLIFVPRFSDYFLFFFSCSSAFIFFHLRFFPFKSLGQHSALFKALSHEIRTFYIFDHTGRSCFELFSQ